MRQRKYKRTDNIRCYHSTQIYFVLFRNQTRDLNMANLQDMPLYEDIPLDTSVNPTIVPSITPKLAKISTERAPTTNAAAQSITILCFILLFVFHKAFSHTKSWTPTTPHAQNRKPTPVPSSIPVIGNLLSFLFAPQELAKSIP